MKNLVNKYRNNELKHYNCAETMIYAANDYYQLNLSDDVLRSGAGFGGGIFEGHLCGIISGAIIVLSILFKEQYSGEEKTLELAAAEFKRSFREKYSKLECNYLVETNNNRENRCNTMIIQGVEILQKVIDKYQ